MHIEIPDDWQPTAPLLENRVTDFMAIGPPGMTGYKPFVLINHAENVFATSELWTRGILTSFVKKLDDFRILDVGSTEIDGKHAIRTVVVFANAGTSITQTLYTCVSHLGEYAGRGHAVTLTCATADYINLAEKLEEMAQSFRVEGRPGE